MTEKSIKIDEAKEYLAKLGGVINTIKQQPSSAKEAETATFLMKLLKICFDEIKNLNAPTNENTAQQPMKKVQESQNFGIDFGELNSAFNSSEEDDGNDWKAALTYGKKESGLGSMNTLDAMFN